jgi:hypothetical protein
MKGFFKGSKNILKKKKTVGAAQSDTHVKNGNDFKKGKTAETAEHEPHVEEGKFSEKSKTAETAQREPDIKKVSHGFLNWRIWPKPISSRFLTLNWFLVL